MIDSGIRQSLQVGKHKFSLTFVSLPSPKVFFIDGPIAPLNTIGVLTRGYKGMYSTDLATDEEIKDSIKDLNNTKLQGPFEMMLFVFLIRDVTRSFTHQLVRTRQASFVQESMRFLGSKDEYRIFIPDSIREDKYSTQIYTSSSSYSITSYEELLQLGVSSEDARDVLPHGIMTSVFVGIPLSSLRHMYEQRMCCQAQPGQWQIVMQKMKDLIIQQYGDEAKDLLSAPFERGEPCGYRASFDRSCKWTKDSK